MTGTQRIERLKSLLVDSPKDSFLMHALGLEYIKAGDDAAARKLFEDLLHANPSYVGTWYHLAKLLERTGEIDAALKTYEQGMIKTKEAGDNHAYNELRSAFEELSF